MGGGWLGYVYVFFGCGAALALVFGSTLLLYAVARVQRRRRPERRVRVTSLTETSDDRRDVA